MTWPAFVTDWGSTESERARAYPCDTFMADPTDTLFRAVDVDAPAGVVFRWLCQLRAAPYSYDTLDNLGRRSPQELTPGLDDLAVGQKVMSVFRLAHFEPGRSLTITTRGPLGRFAVTYDVAPAGPDRSRIVVKLLGRTPLPLRLVFPPGDLVMMRRQLLNLKGLAERSTEHRSLVFAAARV